MKCLFCSDFEMTPEIHWYGSAKFVDQITCKLCKTLYDFVYNEESKIQISWYQIRIDYNNFRYLLKICDGYAYLRSQDFRKDWYSTNSGGYSAEVGRVKNICSFKIKDNSITPFNFAQKLPTLLTFL